jgi:3-oxoacyl-[acyl-carrier protein] reductase
MDLQVKDRVVMVTGASGEIGAATATAFAREGARVIVARHHGAERATEVVDAIRAAGGHADAVELDQGDPESIRHVVTELTTQYGGIDGLVGNAVRWPEPEEDWTALLNSLAVNVAGTITLVEAVLPAMRSRGWGRIVLVSSDVVVQPMPAGAGYPAAKAAIEAAARVLAVREAARGIFTNVVRPGFTLTERARTHPWLGQSAIDAEAAKTPTGRICTPDDVAGTIAYLGSGANTHVNGETMSVAGGRHLTR